MKLTMEAIITIQSITIGLISVGLFFIKRFINEQDRRWVEQDRFRLETGNEVHEMRTNYLDRFKEVNNSISNTERILRDKLTESERNIISKIIELKKD